MTSNAPAGAAEMVKAIMEDESRITFTWGFPLHTDGPARLIGAYVEVRRDNRWRKIGPTLYAPSDDNTRGGVLRSLTAIADGKVFL